MTKVGTRESTTEEQRAVAVEEEAKVGEAVRMKVGVGVGLGEI